MHWFFNTTFNCTFYCKISFLKKKVAKQKKKKRFLWKKKKRNMFVWQFLGKSVTGISTNTCISSIQTLKHTQKLFCVLDRRWMPVFVLLKYFEHKISLKIVWKTQYPAQHICDSYSHLFFFLYVHEIIIFFGLVTSLVVISSERKIEYHVILFMEFNLIKFCENIFNIRCMINHVVGNKAVVILNVNYIFHIIPKKLL